MLDSANVLQNLARRAVSPLPAFLGDGCTGVRVVWENTARKPRAYLLIPPRLSGYNIREDLVAGNNKVDGRPKGKQVCLPIGLKVVFPGAKVSARLARPSRQDNLAVLGKITTLKIGQLNVEILVEQDVCGLDVAVKHPLRMDMFNRLDHLPAPSHPLLKRKGALRLGQEAEDCPICCTLEVQASISESFVRDDPGMVASDVENFVFELEARHVTARCEGVLEDGRVINLTDEGAGSGS